jgi:hypothetical protein
MPTHFETGGEEVDALPFCYAAKVIDREDPSGDGRIRFSVPGLISKSAWARPIGTGGGGSENVGLFAVPELDATVLVWFIQGDRDKPVYLSGWWAHGTTHELAKKSPPDSRVLSSGSLSIELSENDGDRRVTIRDDEQDTLIQIDATNHVITIQSVTSVIIEAVGSISLDAPNVFLKGRAVRPVDEAI